MNENVLVTGATGKVGGQVVRLLLERGASVKAGTRRPERGRKILPKGAEVVELDYTRTETYDAAVEWADRVFLVPPPFDPHAYRTLSSFVDWAVSAKVRHVVLLSAMGVEDRPDVPLRSVETQLQGSGVDWTVLRPNVYMQNFHPGFLGREIREEGVFRIPAGDGRVSLVDGRDVAAVAAECLTGSRHLGRIRTLTGPEALSHDEVAAVLSEEAGREVRYEAVEDERMRERLLERGWPEDQLEVVLRFFASIREGDRAHVTGDVADVLGREATSFRAFAQENAAAWQV